MCNSQHTWDLWAMVIKHHEWESLNLYCWPEELDHGTSTTGDIAYKTKLRLHPFFVDSTAIVGATVGQNPDTLVV
jgi:hypothetical protein